MNNNNHGEYETDDNFGLYNLKEEAYELNGYFCERTEN